MKTPRGSRRRFLGAWGRMPQSSEAVDTGAFCPRHPPWERLKNLAALLALIAGCTPASPSANIARPIAPAKPSTIQHNTLPNVRFVDITQESGVRFVHHNGATGEKLLPETMGSGVAFLDYDNDGDPDLLLVNSDDWPQNQESPRPTQALYRNDGHGHFEDVTTPSGFARSFFGMGVAVGDYDNDGDPDIYLTALGGGHLFRNDGGRFVDVTEPANAHASKGWLTSAAFLDIENDGDLDLFVASYVDWSAETDRQQDFQLLGTGQGRAYGPPTAFNGSFCILLRNDGGRFTDVSESAGVRVVTPDLNVPAAKALGVAPHDVDGDGLVDLAVANDTVPNFLFHNLGGGKFAEIGLNSGVALDASGLARAGMGLDWADFKNDGSLALAIANFANESTALYVSDDPSRLQFADLANVYGLGAPTQPPMKFGLFFFDFNLDGRLDLLTTNGHLESAIARVQSRQTYAQSAQLFWNTGRSDRPGFAALGPESTGPDLFAPIVGRGSRLCRHRQRRRPRRRHDRQRRPRPALSQRRWQHESLAPAQADRHRFQPKRHRRQRASRERRTGPAPAALPGQRVSFLGRDDPDLRARPRQNRQEREHSMAIGSEDHAQRPRGGPNLSGR